MNVASERAAMAMEGRAAGAVRARRAPGAGRPVRPRGIDAHGARFTPDFKPPDRATWAKLAPFPRAPVSRVGRWARHCNGDNDDMAYRTLIAPCTLALFITMAGCGSSEPTPATPDSTSTASADSNATPSSDASADEGATEGKHAPEVKAAYVTGDGPKTLADATGKVVILDFWGTYCGPCKASFPKYQALLDSMGNDLAIIAVSEDEPDSATEADLKKFAKERGVKFVILWDKDKTDAKKYNPETMPTSFVIDKDGKIAHVHTGYKDDEDQKISAEVKALIGG
jgi:peroxiredoxin